MLMPEVQTYTFSHKELLELMVKSSGIHEGEWMLQVTFGFTAANFGQNEEDTNPGGMVIVQKIGITKALDGAPKSLVVDASKVNPRAT
jgi:hypothetical protein